MMNRTTSTVTPSLIVSNLLVNDRERRGDLAEVRVKNRFVGDSIELMTAGQLNDSSIWKIKDRSRCRPGMVTCFTCRFHNVNLEHALLMRTTSGNTCGA